MDTCFHFEEKVGGEWASRGWRGLAGSPCCRKQKMYQGASVDKLLCHQRIRTSGQRQFNHLETASKTLKPWNNHNYLLKLFFLAIGPKAFMWLWTYVHSWAPIFLMCQSRKWCNFTGLPHLSGASVACRGALREKRHRTGQSIQTTSAGSFPQEEIRIIAQDVEINKPWTLYCIGQLMMDVCYYCSLVQYIIN